MLMCFSCISVMFDLAHLAIHFSVMFYVVHYIVTILATLSKSEMFVLFAE